ncbi:hypothetical protein FI667_g7480, partial [Globisporangium splendens]
MIDVVRSNSMPLGSMSSFRMDAEYLDQYGAIRRSGSVANGKLEYLSLAFPMCSLADESEADEEEEMTLQMLSELEAEEVKKTKELKKLRRDRMIMEVQDRLELWHEASELDPAVETTSEHTPLTPSSKAQSFIDSDSNIRRKSSIANHAEFSSASPIPSPQAGSPMSGFVSVARKSIALEFLQVIMSD